MSVSSVINERPLPPEVIIASVLVSPKVHNTKTMGEVAKLIISLNSRGVKTSRMVCYLTAGSAYCEDLDRFVSKLVSFGYATDSSPIKLTPAGKEICQKVIDSAKKEDLEQLRKLNEIL